MNYLHQPTDEALDQLGLLNQSQSVKVDQEAARARKWTAEASIRELELEEKQGSLISRDKVKDATVVILATLAQTLNSLPDQLERRCGLTPKQADEAQKAISQALASASAAMKGLSGEA